MRDFRRDFRRTPVALAGMFAAVLLTAAPAAAQSWPTRPVKFIVSLGPGSGVDIESRLFADRLGARWGQPVVIENRPGGDGIVAIGAFVKAHDDHVLLASPTSSFTAHPFLYDNLPYKPSDLQPIVRMSNTVVAISVPSALNISSLKELFDRARKEPGSLNWAGVTGALDFLLEGFLKGEGLDLKKVPYRNPVEAVNDLSENRVQVYEGALAIVRPHLQSGKIKVLAVTNTTRSPAYPDIPTVAEAGFPGLTVDGLVGLFGPSDMPAALRDRIAADVKAVADKTIEERLAATAQILNVGGAAEFAKSIDEQRAQVAEMAKRLGVAEKQ
ncbi:MAG TPA: tripartite tricarboxylate transporter substrate binding protein [Xanthobacteraceae bacterium]|nr:tripartite tricarboxylate transporter substrate binding protein [Xanthobacteraceae bacterium]